MKPHSSRWWAARILVGASPLILAACAVGPTYQRPTTDLAPFHSSVPTVIGPVAPTPLDTWWIGFADTELTRVVQRALDQNLDIQASLARVRQARAMAQAAHAQLLPAIDTVGSVTTEQQSVVGPIGSIAHGLPGYDRNQQEYQVGGSASWELDLFGGLRRGSSAARDEFEAAEADSVGTRIIVAAEAADAYLQVRAFQQSLAVALDQIQTDTKLLSLVHVRLDQGAADNREISQAEALVRQAHASLPPLKIALDTQLNRLDVLMGAQPGSYADGLRVVKQVPSIPPIGTGAEPVEVLRRRPDIIAAERRLAASNERIGAAIAEYYPKLSLAGALGFDSLTTTNLFSARAVQPVGSGLLRWRLFDFGRVDAEVKQARGANAEALAVYRQAVLRAAEDVEDALVGLAQTQQRVAELEGAVTALRRSRELSETAYKSGSIPLTDVLEANRELLAAQGDLSRSKADAARAAVRTFRSLGGGWRPPSPTQTTERK